MARPVARCQAREGGVRCQLPRTHQSRHANVEGEELVMWRNEQPQPNAEPEPPPAEDEDEPC